MEGERGVRVTSSWKGESNPVLYLYMGGENTKGGVSSL